MSAVCVVAMCEKSPSVGELGSESVWHRPACEPSKSGQPTKADRSEPDRFVPPVKSGLHTSNVALEVGGAQLKINDSAPGTDSAEADQTRGGRLLRGKACPPFCLTSEARGTTGLWDDPTTFGYSSMSGTEAIPWSARGDARDRALRRSKPDRPVGRRPGDLDGNVIRDGGPAWRTEIAADAIGVEIDLQLPSVMRGTAD